MIKKNKKRLFWVTDTSLENSLHKNARIQPAVELIKLGWEVSLVSFEIPRNKDNSIDYVEIFWPKVYFLGPLIYYLNIVFLVIRKKKVFDIIFFQMDSMSILLLLIPICNIIQSKKIKVVVDYRSLPMDTYSIRGKLRSIVFHVGVILVDRLNLSSTAISEKIAEILKVRKTQLIGIWPSGANPKEFEICLKNRKFPENDEPIKFIYLGSLRSERNLITVIKAAEVVLSRGHKITMDLIGSGDQMLELKNLVKKINLKTIRVEGPVPFKMVPAILSERHIGILPFPNNKSMNVSSAIKMFEYIAAGMPVMATDIEAQRRVFKNEKFVFWCKENMESMAKTMENVIENKNKLPQLSKLAKGYSLNWSWESSAKKLNEALQKVV